MGFESYKGENFKLTWNMQVELARRFFGLPKDAARKELDGIVLQWVDMNNRTNSSKFRELVEARPELIELYKMNPESALAKIEEQIYEKETV